MNRKIDNSSNLYAWYLGKQYPIITGRNENEGEQNRTEINIKFDSTECNFIIHPDYVNDIPILLKRFYTKETKRLVLSIIKKYQKQLTKQPKEVSIKDSYAFWGQCTSKQEVIFHWRLAMVPEEVMQYVVIHELCHLVHMNHDRSFWRLVGKFCPNYEELQLSLAWYQDHM